MAFVVADRGSDCPLIITEARLLCAELIDELSESECNAAGCCWDEDGNDVRRKCYRKGNNICKEMESTATTLASRCSV